MSQRCGRIATGRHSWATFRNAVYTAMPGVLESMVTGWWHDLPLHAPTDGVTANPDEGAPDDTRDTETTNIEDSENAKLKAAEDRRKAEART